MVRACAAFTAILVLAVAGCTRPRHYELRGQVVSVDPARQQITIRHEDIRGFMPGMTMPFWVRETPLIEQRTPALVRRSRNAAPSVGLERAGMAVTFTYTRCPLPNLCPLTGARASNWNFLTGDQQVVDGFASRFGVSVISEDPRALEIVHNVRTLVVDADRRLVKVLSGNEWTPTDLLNDLRAASAVW